jgi:hypothetical protein
LGAGIDGLDTGEYALGEQVDEVGLVVDVAVEGHHTGSEVPGEGRHGKRLEAVSVNDLEGAFDDVEEQASARRQSGTNSGPPRVSQAAATRTRYELRSDPNGSSRFPHVNGIGASANDNRRITLLPRCDLSRRISD